MFSMIYEIRVGAEVRAVRTALKYRFVMEAVEEAEAIVNIVSVRVFDKTGFRVYSKRLEKRG